MFRFQTKTDERVDMPEICCLRERLLPRHEEVSRYNTVRAVSFLLSWSIVAYLHHYLTFVTLIYIYAVGMSFNL